MGCVNIKYNPDVVNSMDAQKESYAIRGTIMDIIKVTIGGDMPSRMGVADFDTESDIASLAHSNIAKKDAVELLIQTNTGKIVSIIQQASSYSYVKNQKVRIIKRNGKSRVVPFK